MTFINDKTFMIDSQRGQELYQKYAKNLPIFDYHCHLSPEMIANDHVFEDITEIWLAGDHYKWRAMRANGVSEEDITGSASNYQKFERWAETVKSTLRNPLFHWTALELKRYFDIDEILSAENAERIFNQTNQKIKDDQMTARYFIEQSNVDLIGTTDNPDDSLEFHQQILEDESFDVKVVPTFRPDAAMNIEHDTFTPHVKRLEELTEITIDTYDNFIKALQNRIDFFVGLGCVASDHALETVEYLESTDEEIEAIFQKGLAGEEISYDEKIKYLSRILNDLGKYYYEHDIVMQIHYGALRNNNSYYFKKLGPDTGFDSIRDVGNDAIGLNQLLDSLALEQKLPKMVVYPLNPNQYDLIASTIANFQVNEEGTKSKIQLGSGWWFNDTERGMKAQIDALSDHGLLFNFVGMLTDSRSFLSYPRHEYFRRILCNVIGQDVESGRIPDDEQLLKEMIENICYYNAKSFFER